MRKRRAPQRIKGKITSKLEKTSVPNVMSKGGTPPLGPPFQVETESKERNQSNWQSRLQGPERDIVLGSLDVLMRGHRLPALYKTCNLQCDAFSESRAPEVYAGP